MEVIVEGDGARATRTGDRGLSIQGEQCCSGVRGVDDVAQLPADDRVIAIVAGDGVAEVATFLVAVEILTSIEPAPRPLIDVAAQRAEVADQR